MTLSPSRAGAGPATGLHVGRVINEYQEQFGRGDFLVRNVHRRRPHERAPSPSATWCAPARPCSFTSATPRAPTKICASCWRRPSADGRRRRALLVHLQWPRHAAVRPAASRRRRVIGELLGRLPRGRFFRPRGNGPGGRQELPARLHGQHRAVSAHCRWSVVSMPPRNGLLGLAVEWTSVHLGRRTRWTENL